MLLSLSIKNYLLIDSIELNFNRGFSVITGETGAGKSIILGAISMLFGKRAEAVIMPDKDSKCVIEASFDLSEQNLKGFFDELEVDFENITHIRRELLPAGKSRAFVNDSPVNLSTLKTISEKLFDLHSQHESLLLSIPDYRMQIIDSIAETSKIYLQYKDLFSSWNETKFELKNARQNLEQSRRDIDYYKFQVEQIDASKLSDNDDSLFRRHL